MSDINYRGYRIEYLPPTQFIAGEYLIYRGESLAGSEETEQKAKTLIDRLIVAGVDHEGLL